MKVGNTVIRKGLKKRSKVVRVLDKRNPQNNWNGWVEVHPPLSGFTRWHKDELEVVKR